MSVSFVLYLFDMTNTTHIIQKTLFHHFYFGKTYSQECVEHYFRWACYYKENRCTQVVFWVFWQNLLYFKERIYDLFPFKALAFVACLL